MLCYRHDGDGSYVTGMMAMAAMDSELVIDDTVINTLTTIV